jgi:anaerobic ribonucleoside-triphosphate reductase activating protein
VNEHALRFHHYEPTSRSNGPGLRFVLWLQGCTLGCPGCFNPETHSGSAGIKTPVSDLLQTIVESGSAVQGVTISGGEPLQQLRPLAELLAGIRSQTDLSIVLFSGYSWREIQRMPAVANILSLIDVLISGRYLAEQRLAHSLIGSRNKTLHFLTDRYQARDFEHIPEAEIIINPDGDLSLSGIDPLTW